MRDYEAEFSRNQAVAETAVSTNVVKVPGGDIGKGRPVYIQIDANGYTGDGSLTVEVQTADTADVADDDWLRIEDLIIANSALLKGGTVKVGTIATGAKQYLRLNYVVNGTLAGGKITAGLLLSGDTATM